MQTDPDARDEGVAQPGVEFQDCTRVQITGTYEDVLLGVTFVSDDGETGTVVDSVGGVDGERTIDSAVEFDLSPESTVIEYAELFESEAAIPGLGDVRVENPQFEDCYLERVDGENGGLGSSPYAEFLDCETVRVTEPAAEVLLSLFWWDERGQLGTITEPVGSVEEERTISATTEFGTFAYGPVITGVELFDAGTPTVPGGGDVSVRNPDAESCATSIRDAYDGPDELDESPPERS
ncbi:hypothetical protein [Natronorubrum texcoconense]|uniref:Uncharacterized protein n=1 Tax=Natronorubrum texcoconense TaxID=1095776 RepID=A0A1G9FQH2_9EURY|nr:hypothetical protein [Natronorubrum texcoconense]SDK90629.1 hypothetical protein SAMN04515672_4239 [Natronorubrum texcoconense]